MKRFLKLAPLLAFFSMTSYSANAEECLKVASHTKDNASLRILSKGIKSAFKEAGICTEYLNMPVKRIQAQMTQGAIDAEFLRVKPYIQAMSAHVTHIPTPIVSGSGHIVTMASSGFKPEGVQDVGDKTIGIVHGYKWHSVIGQNLKKTKKGKKYHILAKQLKAGRIDGFLTEDASLNRLVNAGIFKKEELHLSKPVIDISLYLVLHKKNAALVDKLDQAVKKVKSAGGFKLPQ